MERNLIIAIVMSVAVLFLWNVVINPPPPPDPNAPVQTEPETPKDIPEKKNVAENEPLFEEKAESDAPPMLPALDQTAKTVEKPAEAKPDELAKTPTADAAEAENGEAAADATLKPAAPEPPKPAEPAKIPEEMVTIETEAFKAVFTNYGARLKSFVLKNEKYTEALPGTKERVPVNIVRATRPENLPYTLVLDQANFNYEPDQPYEVESRDAASVTFKTSTPQGVVVRKRFALEKDYLFNLDVSFENRAKAAVSFFPKLRMVGFQDDRNLQSGVFGTAALNLQIPKAYVDGELWEETDKADLETPVFKKGHILWTAIDDRYFLLALLPPEDVRSQIAVKNVIRSTEGTDGETHQNWLGVTHSLEQQSIVPGGTLTLPYRIFVGPKEYETLNKVGRHFQESVDFWVLGFLAKPMLYVLQYSYSAVGNWGVAIIILTIIIKLLLHPLTNKSFKSMQKMKDLKPKMDELKAKYGEDKQEFNRQMMDLYKREGVNPMGGCLPMLLQMPVYIALYKMLQNSVELYNSPFIPGWLNDLVQPDPYYVLPVLLSALMFVQQKLSPSPDSQQQKMMMIMMPLMMLFFMLVLPSGLVLYILANTVMTIAQQWWINKKSKEGQAAAPAKA